MQEDWINAKERQPEKMDGMPYSHHVLCVTKSALVIGFYFHDDNTWIDADPSNLSKEVKIIEVVLWKPLPKHPLKEE